MSSIESSSKNIATRKTTSLTTPYRTKQRSLFISWNNLFSSVLPNMAK